MKRKFIFTSLAILIIAVSSCTEVGKAVNPFNGENELSVETINEVNQLKESMGSEVAYEVVTLMDKDKLAKVKLAIVAPSEEILKEAISFNKIEFLVNQSLELNSVPDNLSELPNELVSSDFGIHYIFDEIISNIEIKNYGLSFSTDEVENESENLRRGVQWTYGNWIKSNVGATIAYAQRAAYF